MDKDYSFKPLEDPKSKPFMEASNQLMTSLLKGSSAGDALQKSKDKFKGAYRKLLASNTDLDSLSAAQYLWWDERHLICSGDPKATI